MQDIYYHLSRLLGVSLEITDSNLIPYTENTGNSFCTKVQKHLGYAALAEQCCKCKKKLLEQCKKSGELVWHICHNGLFFAMMPIVKGVNVVAFLSLGPLRVDDSQIPEEITDDSLKRLYENLPCFSENKLIDLKHVLAHLVFSVNFQTEDDDTLIKQIISYIHMNIHRNLRLSDLCGTFQLSKNHLYKLFAENMNITVNEYIIQCRVKQAKKLLKETENDICVIAENMGFKNPSYFSNFFKKHTGMTPGQYQKKGS